MLSKNSMKNINSLRVKKIRNEQGVFIAEGSRLTDELLNSTLIIKSIYHTSDWSPIKNERKIETIEVGVDEMKKISGLSSPSYVLALVEIPEYDVAVIDFSNTLTIALEGVQDPGNLGTIIRLADWFGIDTIVCSNDTADAFSPKVVQSCMGAISRVKVVYCDLLEFLDKYRTSYKLPIYGTFMEGENIYEEKLSSAGIIVMGNEGNGISPEMERLVTQKIHIPTFATNRIAVESLNVAMATAIVCSEFKSRSIKK